jgi:hypothetical protein
MAQGFFVANVGMAVTLFIAWAQEVWWKKVAFMMCALLLTPTHSGYYCGLYMFIPLIFFLNEKRHRVWDVLYLVLFLLLFNPVQFALPLPQVPGLRQEITNYMVQNMAAIVLYIVLFIDTVCQLLRKVRIWKKRRVEENG